jgi:multidrug efflux pump
LIGRGAGAEMRRTLGTAVFSGMLGVTMFGIFLTPVFFNVIDWLGGRRLLQIPGMRLVLHILLIVFTVAVVVFLAWLAQSWMVLGAAILLLAWWLVRLARRNGPPPSPPGTSFTQP